MNDFHDSLTLAASMILSGDANLVGTIGLTLTVSMSSVLCASILALPLGALLALAKFPGRDGVITMLNASMGLPPVVVGLLVYLMLSRSGPLGGLGILFTPAAMIAAQTILVLPIIAALTRQCIQDLWEEYGDLLTSMGQTRVKAVMTLLWEGRFRLVTAVLAGFGRAMAEVGAVMIVGGNIAGVTRTMTTSIVLETGKGDLPRALALGLVLIALGIAVNATVNLLGSIAAKGGA